MSNNQTFHIPPPEQPSKVTRVLDLITAIGCGASVFLIAIGVKAVPGVVANSILTLGLGYWWVLALVIFSIGAGVGVILRTNKEGRRKVISNGLEYVFWLGMAGCVWIFGACALDAFGLLDGLTTIGFTLALGVACVSRWWNVQYSLLKESRQIGAGKELIDRMNQYNQSESPSTSEDS